MKKLICMAIFSAGFVLGQNIGITDTEKEKCIAKLMMFESMTEIALENKGLRLPVKLPIN